MGVLDDKVVVITGGGRGLGEAFSQACCEAGARVVVAELCADLGRHVTEGLIEQGYDATYVSLDVCDPSSAAALPGAVLKRYGRIDGLVNNAAIASGLGGKSYSEIDIETWDHVMATNVRGVWLVVKACAPYIRDGGGGAIINIGSDTAEWGAPRLLHYVTSKGAISAMSRALARELGPDRVSVNTVAPGLVITESTKSAAPDRHQMYVSGRAMPREQWPDDVAGTVVFLLSDTARFITGQLILVNGGFVCR